MQTIEAPVKQAEPAVLVKNDEIVRDDDSLLLLQIYGKVSINVYTNFERRGVTGEDVFLADMLAAGVQIPDFSADAVKPRYDDKGRMTSPRYAWQGTVTIPLKNASIPVLLEMKRLCGDSELKQVGKNVVCHSSRLAIEVLRGQQRP